MAMNNVKTVFLIAGESASGKDTFVHKICEECGYSQLTSYTTRPRRTDEGETHIFISKEEVEKYKYSIVAYTKIGEYEYFSTINQLYESDFYVIDPKGIKYLKEKVDDPSIRFVTIYINVPPDIREDRAVNVRGDKYKVYTNRRFNEFDQFLNFKSGANFDYAIPNIDFEKAYEVFKCIVKTELDI